MKLKTTYRNVDHINDIIRQLPRIIGREVISPTLDKEDLAAVFRLESLEGSHVGGDILANGGVGASAGLDGEDAVGGEGFVVDEKFLVLAGEDVVCYGGWWGKRERGDGVSDDWWNCGGGAYLDIRIHDMGLRVGEAVQRG